MSLFVLTDEHRFERDFRVLGATGLASGLVAAMLIAIAGSHHYELMALSFGGVLGVAASFAPGEGETPIFRVTAALAGAVLFAGALPTPVVAAALAGGAFGGVLSVEDDRPGQIASILTGAGALAAGYFTTSTLLGGALVDAGSWPVLSDVLTGGVWAAFLTASAGIRRLRWAGDATTRRVESAADRLDSPEAEHLESALDLYEPVRGAFMDLEDEGLRRNAESITGEVLRALVRFCERSAELREARSGDRRHTLEARIASMDYRIEAAQQSDVVEELRAARSELEQEADVRERIATAITRLEVRQQRCLTALERLHMKLVESGAAGIAEMRLETSIEELDDLTEQMEWRNLSLDAICSSETTVRDHEAGDPDRFLDAIDRPDEASESPDKSGENAEQETEADVELAETSS